MKTLLECLAKPRGFALVALMAASLSAANAGEIQIRAVSAKPGFPEGEIFAHEPGGWGQGKLLTVKAFLNDEFDSIKLKGRVLVFTTRADRSSVKDPSLVYGKVEFKAGRNSAVCVFVPSTEEDKPGVVVDVDDSFKAFPAGATMVINQCSNPVKIQLDDEAHEFKAGEAKLIRKFPGGAPRARAIVSVERGGDWERAATGMWVSPGRKRSIQVIVEDQAGRSIVVRDIRDNLMPDSDD